MNPFTMAGWTLILFALIGQQMAEWRATGVTYLPTYALLATILGGGALGWAYFHEPWAEGRVLGAAALIAGLVGAGLFGIKLRDFFRVEIVKWRRDRLKPRR